MITIDLISGEAVWYGCCYRFASGEEAKEAWQSVNEIAPADGSWHVGIMRHMRVGLDKEPVLVSVVGDVREGVERAEIALIALEGDETELHPETWVQLCARRAAAVLALDAGGAGTGRHRILHPPGGDVL